MVDQLAVVRRGGDAGGARGRHRRPARRPGRRAGRGRHVEGPDRHRELDGEQPDRAGAQHRGRDDGGGEGRPLEEDHGGREGRDPGAEEHHQHDGGPALVVRRGGDAGGARGGHRRQARRPGAGAGRVGHVEGPDRPRELHGRQPDPPGARHRQGGDRGGGRRPQAEADRGSEGRDRGAGRHHQQHDRHARDVRRPGDERGARGGRRRQARRPGEGAGRRGHVEGPHREREPARGKPDHAGARDRGGGDRRDARAT